MRLRSVTDSRLCWNAAMQWQDDVHCRVRDPQTYK